jgi:hypothetical protein
MATHVKVIAVFYVAAGVLLLIGAFFSQIVLALLAGIVGASGEEGAAVGAGILGFAGVALTLLLLAFAVPFLVTSWGLFKLRPWARILGIILAAICLTQIPFGTLLGVYALIVFFQKDTERLFQVQPPN